MKRQYEQPAVFCQLRDTPCTECGEVIERGEFAFLEARKPLCLRCADLDHLVFLPSGDATLTRRAVKRSLLSAVVLRFSQARKRSERQGVLVEEVALEAAEEECLLDASARAVRRKESAARRDVQDHVFVAQMKEAICKLFPRCRSEEVDAIAEHTSERGSGRVGRSAGGTALDPEAVTLAVVAAVRHRYTNYDELLFNGYEWLEGREQVRDAIEEVLKRWRDEEQPRRGTPSQGCVTEQR